MLRAEWCGPLRELKLPYPAGVRGADLAGALPDILLEAARQTGLRGGVRVVLGEADVLISAPAEVVFALAAFVEQKFRAAEAALAGRKVAYVRYVPLEGGERSQTEKMLDGFGRKLANSTLARIEYRAAKALQVMALFNAAVNQTIAGIVAEATATLAVQLA